MINALAPAHWRPTTHRARPTGAARAHGTKMPERRRTLIITGHIGLGWSGRATGLAAHRTIVRSHSGHVVIALALGNARGPDGSQQPGRLVATTLQFRVMF